LAGWLVGWLVGWFVGWLVGWLAGWLVDWLVGWMVGWISMHFIDFYGFPLISMDLYFNGFQWIPMDLGCEQQAAGGGRRSPY
jgi:hypothetical protein